MGVEPPFLYDPPSRYSFSGPTEKGFNPKAATQASWSPPAAKPRADGPLINFNQHPDSYLIVPYGNLNAKPMSPNTKNKVKYSRQIQLALRVLALFGALGILFCVIAIKGTSGSLGWIIRVAPGVALLHTVYAIYHLCRSPTGRTAGSSASYMVFAAMIDAGLLPFLAFSAFMAHKEHTTQAYGWDTLFEDPLITWYIVYSTFIACVVEGGLLLISLILGIYLAILFRKIAKLPPDMNPLEPNLTARPHKRTKSELTTSDKHMSQTSLVSDHRMSSTADPLITPGRRVPFMHTRTDSADSIPIYQNNSPRSSRADLAKPTNLYQQSNHSFRNSYMPLNNPLPSPPSRPQSAIAPSITSRNAGAGLDHRPARSSQLAQTDTNNWQSTPPKGRVSPLETYHQLATTPRYPPAQQTNDENVAPISPISSAPSTPDPDRAAEYMSIKNWYESPHTKNKRSQDYLPVPQRQQMYRSPDHTRRESLYDFDRDLRSPSPPTHNKVEEDNKPRNPLGMNPPSPAPPEPPQQDEQAAGGDVQKRYILHDAPLNLPPPSPRPRLNGSRPSSFIGSGSKGKYYGDLRSPVGSISLGSGRAGPGEREKEMAGAGAKSWSDGASEYSFEESAREAARTGTMDSHIEIYSDTEPETDVVHDSQVTYNNGFKSPAGFSHQQQSEKGWEREKEDLRHSTRYVGNSQNAVAVRVENENENDKKGRVISSSGFDLSSSYSYAGLGQEFGRGMGRRREVSGKVVEEGRAGAGAGAGGANQSEFKNLGRGEQGVGVAGLTAEERVLARLRDNAVKEGDLDKQGSGSGVGMGDPKPKLNVSSKRGMGAAGWARFKGL